MDPIVEKMLEAITREAFRAGHARGQLDAVAKLMPHAVETFKAQFPKEYEDLPRSEEDYLNYVKAGVILKRNGFK